MNTRSTSIESNSQTDQQQIEMYDKQQCTRDSQIFDVQEYSGIEPKKNVCNAKTILKICLLAILATIVTITIIFRNDIYGWFTIFTDQVEKNPYLMAFFIFICFTICTVILFPPMIIQLCSGYAYYQALKSTCLTLLIVTPACFMGAMIGGTTSMLLGRYIFRETVQDQIKKYPIMDSIDMVMKKKGLKITLLLRLCPLIPFMLFNYFLGVTSITLRDYVISMNGMIPEIMMCVYIGLTLNNLQDIFEGNYDGGNLQKGFMIGGSVIVIGVITYVTFLTKKYLKQQIVVLRRSGVIMEFKTLIQGLLF